MEPNVDIYFPKPGSTDDVPLSQTTAGPRSSASEIPPPSHEYHELRSKAPGNTFTDLQHDPPAIIEEVQKMANPAPLGLCAFALTSFVINSFTVFMPNTSPAGIIVGLPLVYGGLAQVLVGMWEMTVGNTFGAVTFSSYGSYWVASAIISWIDDVGLSDKREAGVCQQALPMGLYMMAWFIFTSLMLLCTLKSSVAMFLLFFFLDMNYLLLGISHFQCEAHGGVKALVERAGGVFGLLAAFTAWYNALAGVVDTSNGLFSVPVGHFPWSPVTHTHRAKVKAG